MAAANLAKVPGLHGVSLVLLDQHPDQSFVQRGGVAGQHGNRLLPELGSTADGVGRQWVSWSPVAWAYHPASPGSALARWPARQALSEAAQRAAWAEGQALALVEAIALALVEAGPSI